MLRHTIAAIFSRRLLWAPAIAVVASAALLLTFALDGAPAQGATDISGHWDIAVSGDIGLDCDAEIAQAGANVSMEIACAGLGSGSFSGTFDEDSRLLTLTGSKLGIPVNLAGEVSADGGSIAGFWTADVLDFSGTFSAARAAPAETPTPLPTLTSPVDVTGTWRTEVSGILPGTCLSVIEQHATELTAIASCDIMFNGGFNLTGTIDPLTGAFSLSDSLFQLTGVAAADGNSFSGTWHAADLSGALTGSRDDGIELIDASGHWDFVLASETPTTCSLSIEQLPTTATGALACPGEPAVELTGSVNPFDAFLTFHGMAEGSYVALYGTAAPDLSYLMGSVRRPDEEPVVFIAVPEASAARGILALDCRAEVAGLQPDCSALAGEDWAGQVYVVVPPAGGYEALRAELHYSGFVTVQPPLPNLTPAGPPPCDVVEWTPVQDGYGLLCSGPVAGPVSTAGGVIEVPLTCADRGESTLSFVAGSLEEPATYFSGPGGTEAPTLVTSTVYCFEQQHGGGELPMGDANCDGRANSIDAALVLQLTAGLLDALPCPSFADVDRDLSPTSIDAALILQIDADLYEPPVP